MRLDETDVHRIAVMAHEAASDQSKWNDVIKAIATSVHSTGGVLFTPTIDPEGRMLSAACGGLADGLRPYVEHWVREDAWNLTIAKSHQFNVAGEVRFGREVLPVSKLRHTAFFNDFLRGQEAEELLALKITDATDTTAPVTHMSLFRAPNSRVFGPQEQKFVAALWPHLQRAVRTYWSLRKLRDHDRIAESMLDAMSQPTFVLRADATVEYANLAARELLRDSNWLKVIAGRLAMIGDLHRAALLEALRRARIGGGRTWIAGYSDSESVRKATVRIAPVSTNSAIATVWYQAFALVSLELQASHEEHRDWLSRRAEEFRLTAAETRLLQQLVAGSALNEVAEELSLSYSTVRSQLRAIFDKTGCRRQTELTRRFGGC